MGQALAFGWGIPLFTAPSLTGFAPEDKENFAVAVDASQAAFTSTRFQRAELLKLEEAGRCPKPFLSSHRPIQAKSFSGLLHLSPSPWREARPSVQMR